MRRVGQARKRDANEAAIVSALRKCGVTVLQISGKGCPDLLCAWQGLWLPLEVKQPGQELTLAQLETQRQAAFPVVQTIDEALLAICGAIERKRRRSGVVVASR